MFQEILVFDVVYDCIYVLGDDLIFQESVLFVWNDFDVGIGGFW